eukprot:NODE_1412_length_967_cov_86.296296_g1090_i0.p1 GENE.NODE_1412_length_967_cov_86.296296_g1090_i0~~NODE_1412_length_967_cov_86.296296_g1090_i0.p1  ORF type:complete len:235 (-),score=36.85 NODE_1412_length_967_cov_86.296296_g1090_i0:186-890(-)
MIAGEVCVGGVVVYWIKKRYFPTQRYCTKTQSLETTDGTAPSAQVVKEKLLELSELGKKKQETGDAESEDENEEAKMDEEEIFGSGVWGVDFGNLRYKEETVLSVQLYEETIKPRAIFPIVHPYILVETPTWMYVLEKWRDGVAVSRFQRKDDAVRSRGKWFGPGRLSQRKMPHLVQSTQSVGLTTTQLLVWTMDHPYFKQYTDNCHTFAANLCKKVEMKNPNSTFEELIYDAY